MRTATTPPAAPDGLARVLLPVATGRQIRNYLRGALSGRRGWLTATVVAMVASSAVGLIGPIAIGIIAQAVADGGDTSAVLLPVALLAAGALISAVTLWAGDVLLARTVLPPVARLREQVVQAALALPLDAVEEGGGGDLMSRVSGDVERVSDAVEGALGSFVSAALAIITTLVGLASVDWRFAVAGLLAVPLQAHTLVWYLRRSRPIYARGRVLDGERTSALLGVFAALPSLRAFRLGQRQLGHVEAASVASMDVEFRATRIATRFYGRLNLAEYIALGAILLVGFLMVGNGDTTVGAATTAALFFAVLFNPINTVLGVFDSIQQAAAALARLIGVTTAAPDRAQGDTVAQGPPPDLAGANLRFGYGGGPDVLHDVSIRVGAGEHVAVVGTTGSGKSTLASLLAGIRRPRAGTVTFAGHDIENLSPAALHGGVALVTQETHVFVGTIADNLRMSAPHADDAAITAALCAVGADPWIDALPDGLHTVVGAGTVPLPAGHAQQMALARLLLLDPEVVILDEATAEAGSAAARQLDAAAARVLDGRTALVVAHRLSQAAVADSIVVMSHGRIVEQGSHEELIAGHGPYAELWTIWATNPHRPANTTQPS